MAGESQQEPKSAPDPTVITTENIDKAVEGLRELIATQLEGLNALLNERDKRYGERFDAQQVAVQAALAEREAAVQAAFESSEKAILKAEVSIEKRADATYVSLQELSRSLAQLMPREEALTRVNAVSDAQSALALRIERIEAVKTGGNEQRGAIYALAGFVATLLVIGSFAVAALAR